MRLGLVALGVAMLAGCHPLINDISTDREDPPRYLVSPPANPAYDAAALREPTERGYPDLHNLELTQGPATVFDAVAALVAAREWREVARETGHTAAPGTPGQPWRLQAVAVTALLRFKDDVIVEVRPRPDGGATVAMRSKSRVGKGDLGANAKRIRAFLADLAARLESPAAAPGARP